MGLQSVAPILLVRDIVAAAAYWSRLGFESKLFHEPPTFAILSRDEVKLMLAKVPFGASFTTNYHVVGATSDAYIWVSDVDALYAEFQAAGATIDFTLYNTPWGTREFGIQDLDDHDITFGQVL